MYHLRNFICQLSTSHKGIICCFSLEKPFLFSEIFLGNHSTLFNSFHRIVTGYGIGFAAGKCILVLQNCKNDETQINQKNNIEIWGQPRQHHEEDH